MPKTHLVRRRPAIVSTMSFKLYDTSGVFNSVVEFNLCASLPRGLKAYLYISTPSSVGPSTPSKLKAAFIS
jgi:hypothetical protein